MAWAEDDWERAEPPVSLPRPEVAEIVGFEPVAVERLTAGKANTQLRVRGPAGEDRVVRIYQRDPGAAAREGRLLARVAPHVPVPVVYGEASTSLGLPAVVMAFVPGRTPAAVLADAPDQALGVGRALGRALAGLTALEIDGMGLYADDLSLARRFDTVADSFVDLIAHSLRRGRARRRLGPQRSAALAAVVDRAAARLAVLDAHPGLAHGDYKSSNLLLRRDGATELGADRWRVAAVLDWEFACPFTPLLDVAILMRHRDTFPPALQQGFAEAYRAGGGWLPDDWRSLSRVVDLMNLVGFLNAGGDRPRVVAHVTELLMDTGAALEDLG